MKKEVWNDILEIAKWTPSPHNIQPWKVKRLSNRKLQIYCDPKRQIPDLDTTGAFTILSMAMFIDNIKIISSEKGFETKITFEKKIDFYKHQDIFKFAKISLKKIKPKIIEDTSLITQRQTSRLDYENSKVPVATQHELRKIAKRYNHDFDFSSEVNFVKWVLELNCDTMFYDMDDEVNRTELTKWIRFNKKQAKAKKDGLWSYCMLFPGLLMKLFFKQHWLFKIKIVRSITRKIYLRSMKNTKTVGWIKGRFKSFDDWINTGYMFNRVWLCMTKNKIYLHPFGSIITNSKAHRVLKDKMHETENKKELWLIMRLGKSKVPPHSLRIDTKDIWVN